MSLEENLRRTTGFIGQFACVLGLAMLANSLLTMAGIAVFAPGAGAWTAVGLTLLGASLWFQHRDRFPQTGRLCAGVVLGLTLATTVLSAIDADLQANGPAAARPLIPPYLALALAIASVALLTLRRSRHWPGFLLSTWLSGAVCAAATATLAVWALGAASPFASPIRVDPLATVCLLAVGLGTLLAGPEDKLIRVLLTPAATGALARRLFGFGLLLPIGLLAGLGAAVHFGWIGWPQGLISLVFGLVFTALMLATHSARTAVAIDERHRSTEQEQARLNLALERQASHLQELVARRTSELNSVNVNLRTAARENAQFGLVARNTTNGVVIADAQGRIEWANAAFERMTGYGLAEVIGRKPTEFLRGPGTDAGSLAQLLQAGAAGERCYVEILSYTKGGHPYWQIVDTEPVRDAAGVLVNWISIQTDITAHRLTEQHLRTLNERLQLATQSASLGVWEWDAATQRYSWDERTHAIFGLDSAEFDGTHELWLKRLHADDRPLVEARFQAVLAGGNDYDQEFRIIRQHDGLVRNIESRAIVQRDAQGALLRITGTCRDITSEHESEERLRTLTDRWQLALRASGYGVWDWDPTTGKLVWDDRMLEIYGVGPAASTHHYAAWLALVHPEDRARAEQTVAEAIHLGVAEFTSEFRIVQPSGQVRHVATRSYIRRDKQGRHIRLVGMDRDVTADKQTLEALRMAEERWQLAVEGTNDGVWDSNLQTGVVYHDTRWAQMLAYELIEIPATAAGWNDLVHPDDLAGCLAAAEAHFQRATPLYQHEYRMRTKHGEWRWILDRGKVVSWDAKGNPLRMVGMHTDITARKGMEQRLRQFEQLTTQVSEIAQFGSWELDLATMELTWSDQVRSIHEVGPAFQPTVHTALEFYTDDVRDAISTAFKALMTQGSAYDLELPLVTARGRHIWVRTLARAEMKAGRAVRLIGALQDITSRRETEEARRKLDFLLFQAQKMETLGTLSGGIAHDFNNLLTGIIGYQELIADVLGDGHEAGEYLAQARSASLRARELVEQILTFGRESPDDQHVPLELALVIDEARRLLRATIPSTIAIEVAIAPVCGTVLGDATQIHQVVLNLGSNAAHAMAGHPGTLKIGLAPVDADTPRTATFATLPAGDYLRLTVSDNGHGMNEKTIQRIFDPFFTTKNVREGTGLGLAVVHGIVRAHRGAIDVESKVGVGSTFTVYLPVVTLDAELPERPAMQAPRGEGQTVFIVDDEDTVASFTKFALENKGYRALTIDTAENCLATLRANPAACAVLVTDQTMPGMTGTELSEQLRAFAPDLPIVIMSGYFLKIPPEEIAQIGHVELLGKPFSTDELAWTVHRALESGAKVS
jgi:PAS domain S-box-containing protein